MSCRVFLCKQEIRKWFRVKRQTGLASMFCFGRLSLSLTACRAVYPVNTFGVKDTLWRIIIKMNRSVLSYCFHIKWQTNVGATAEFVKAHSIQEDLINTFSSIWRLVLHYCWLEREIHEMSFAQCVASRAATRVRLRCGDIVQTANATSHVSE